MHHDEGAKAATMPQNITHKIGTPALIHHQTDSQRRRVTRGQPTLTFSSLVQLQRAIDAMDSFVIPTVSTPAQAVKEFAEAELRLLMCKLRERINDLLVTVRPRAIAID